MGRKKHSYINLDSVVLARRMASTHGVPKVLQLVKVELILTPLPEMEITNDLLIQITSFSTELTDSGLAS